MALNIPEIGSFVHCEEAAQIGLHPVQHTNVWGGKAHCSYCGETDHPQPQGV